jgi:hypothetical protein
MALYTKRQPEIEAHQFTGKNYDELKAFAPQLEKYNIREMETVGWPTEHGFTEALPGFYIVKEDGEYSILEEHEFKKRFE